MPDTSCEPVPNTPEGWTVEDLASYQFLTRHDPSRPGCYLRQLKTDVCSLNVLRYWATGVGMVVVGLAVFWIEPKVGKLSLAPLGLGLVLVGAFWLYKYLWMVRLVVRSTRQGQLLQGKIRFLQPHPVRGYSTAKARLSDGRSVSVALRSASATALLDQAGQVEVLCLYHPQDQYSSVIGIRPVANGKEEDVARTDASGV